MKRLNKKVLSISLLILLGLIVTACGGADADGGKVVIGYSPPTLEMTDFYAFGENGLKEKADALGLDYEVITKAPSTHAAAEEQLRIIEDFITQGVDYIWLVPVSVEAADPMIRAANEAGIPIITGHNIEPYPDDLTVFAYVGTDFGKTGTAVGEWIADHLGGEGKVAIVQGAPGSFNEWRVENAIAIFDTYDGIEVVASDFTDWSSQNALDVASTMLEAHPDIDLIYAPAAPLTLGVVEALENIGKAGEIEVVDYDLIPATQKLAKEGKVVAGLAMFPWKYGEEVAQIIADDLAGKDIALVHEVPGVVVEADEIDTVFPEWYREGSEPDPEPEETEEVMEPRKIAYVAWNMNNPWSVILRDALKAAVEAQGDEFFESDPSGDPAVQVPQIETFVGQGVDGIILTPTDAQAILPAVQAAADAGIPVVIVGAGANEGAWDAAVLTDNFEGGKQIGEYIVELLGGEGKVVATDVPGIQDAEERRAGWEAAFEGTNIEILDYQTAGTVEAGVTHMENWLQQFGGDEIDAVMGINDPTALGALTVIEEAGLEDQITVVGVDGSDAAIEAMTACRSFGASAAQAPALMGTMSVETLYKIFDGMDVEREVRVSTELLPREDYCTE